METVTLQIQKYAIRGTGLFVKTIDDDNLHKTLVEYEKRARYAAKTTQILHEF